MTRQHGVVASAASLVPFGHLGWGYRDRTEFLTRTAEYLTDGLDHNQWVEYVGDDTHETLRAELAAMPGIAEHPDADDIKISTPREFYAIPTGTDIVDPDVAVTTRVVAIEKAIANGYTGFRGAIDATSVAQTPEQQAAYARFEFLIDQQMTVQPVSTLCAYDLQRLGADADGLICLHPYTNRHTPGLRLYAQPGADFALTGDIDAATDEQFTTTLDRLGPFATDATLVIDARHLAFIGHRQLAALDQYARDQGKTIILHTNQPVATRLAGLLPLTNVQTQPALPRAARELFGT